MRVPSIVPPNIEASRLWTRVVRSLVTSVFLTQASNRSAESEATNWSKLGPASSVTPVITGIPSADAPITAPEAKIEPADSEIAPPSMATSPNPPVAIPIATRAPTATPIFTGGGRLIHVLVTADATDDIVETMLLALLETAWVRDDHQSCPVGSVIPRGLSLA